MESHRGVASSSAESLSSTAATAVLRPSFFQRIVRLKERAFHLCLPEKIVNLTLVSPIDVD